MDMRGTHLHKWVYDESKIQLGEGQTVSPLWFFAYPLARGDILVITQGGKLYKLDKDSNLIWEYGGGVHHCLTRLKNGGCYALTRTARLIPFLSEETPVLEDFVTFIDGNGKALKTVSLLDCLRNGRQDQYLRTIRAGLASKPDADALPPNFTTTGNKGDVLHSNFVEVVDERLASRVGPVKTGHVLVSSRSLSAIMVVDLEKETVVWSLTGEFKGQHNPTVLANGNILVFDNLGGDNSRGSGKSVIREIDPATGEEIWNYRGTPEKPFFSPVNGALQSLPNGNLLVVESVGGRAFEITKEKEIVWEFYNPHRGGDGGQFIATLFNVIRLAPEFSIDWID